MSAYKTRLDDQVAIVTGAARGIGLDIARLMSARGAKVIVWDRDVTPLDRVTDFSPAAVERVDIADNASIERAFAAAVQKFGQIHILVNNAGIGGPNAPAWDYPLEEWDRVIAVNLTGVFYSSRIAARHMRAHRYGRLVTVASIAGKEGVQNLSAYSAAKAGVIGLCKSMAKDLASDGVTVNCIAPAMTATPLLDAMSSEFIETMTAKIPMGRLVQAEEVAELCAWIASPACSFTTGFVFDISGGRATY
jgi:3-oxoacyl-[acyl-carrier protein] reductase